MREDHQQIKGCTVVFTTDKIKMEYICKFYKFGYCKMKEQCWKYHIKEECKDGTHCKTIKNLPTEAS